ncbi:hypothetical protein MBT84_27790 [Streptomyces sp. MBT84]|uniref:LPXTG cell wall anchor domain-containing protein n=1 Tax=Streptomyces sp. MBT84 TaxID=1488414 RepID=UPI001DCCB373|nr:LPXTG cell wall anchor domain-containing protein [Streptomyces sp. MBT84]MBW8703403.1 hypothetical protein [Streptomyces sp. MBT84]
MPADAVLSGSVRALCGDAEETNGGSARPNGGATGPAEAPGRGSARRAAAPGADEVPPKAPCGRLRMAGPAPVVGTPEGSAGVGCTRVGAVGGTAGTGSAEVSVEALRLASPGSASGPPHSAALFAGESERTVAARPFGAPAVADRSGAAGVRGTGTESSTTGSEKDLPPGSNSAFSCAVDNLAAGSSKTYAVDATFDTGETGRICLPVRTSDGKKTYWQQGPVPFGASRPTPNAPATPLLLGTDNTPVGPGGDELPRTGADERVLPLGAAGATLIAAGGAGLWVTRRRPRPQR